jgi:hypothetical protein
MPRRCSGEEEGDVGAEGEADREQPFERPAEAPEAIEGEQRRRGVRAAAAEPGAPRDVLVDRDVDPERVPEAACSARAARRLRSSAGSAAAMSWRRSSPSPRGSTWIVSHQSISTISDSIRCMPSARRPTTCRYRFSLAGAGTS